MKDWEQMTYWERLELHRGCAKLFVGSGIVGTIIAIQECFFGYPESDRIWIPAVGMVIACIWEQFEDRRTKDSAPMARLRRELHDAEKETRVEMLIEAEVQRRLADATRRQSPEKME